MTDWLREHQDNPYPNDDEKEALIISTRLTINQINYWFTNARRRVLPKWALQRHLDEQEKSRRGKVEAPSQIACLSHLLELSLHSVIDTFKLCISFYNHNSVRLNVGPSLHCSQLFISCSASRLKCIEITVGRRLPVDINSNVTFVRRWIRFFSPS